jgi:AraC-like DNA-binding protein
MGAQIMPDARDLTPEFEADGQYGAHLGLFRRESLASGLAGTVTNLFKNLHQVTRGQFIAEHPTRHLKATRLDIDRDHGHGTWEFYRLDQDLYIVAADGVYELLRTETVPGEGLIEFHLRLSGILELAIPGCSKPVVVGAPTLLILYQPVGMDVVERVRPRVRETGISLYCSPAFLKELAQRSGIERWPLLDDIENHSPSAVFLRQLELSSTMQYIANSLLENTHRCGVRLLHAEAKALELLCEFLAAAQAKSMPRNTLSTPGETRQLDCARRLIANNLKSPLRVSDVARSVGMSETKLRRIFKEQLGVTVFDYALECRMRHAINLLRGGRISVGQAAHAVGYRHQTSFASAFQEYFGFLPSKARTEMH